MDAGQSVDLFGYDTLTSQLGVLLVLDQNLYHWLPSAIGFSKCHFENHQRHHMIRCGDGRNTNKSASPSTMY